MLSPNIIWQPQSGPQQVLLASPISEVCYGGARGGGKTDGMLGHFARHEKLYGALAQGIFFRKEYKMLDRVKFRGKQIFGPMGAKFIESKDAYEFRFPSGATLKLRHLKKHDDAENYQGHEYNWLCFEELTQWATPALIDKMRAVNRDSNGVPCFFLSTCNPGNAGHGWVKNRYIAPARSGYQPIMVRAFVPGSDVVVEKQALFIPATVYDNTKLLTSQPDYISNLYLSGPPWLVRAWLDGDWDVLAGGYLEGIWQSERHVVKPFSPPQHWPRWRALDWGFAKPYAIGYFTQDPITEKIFMYRELYGWGGGENIGSREDAIEVKTKLWEIEKLEVAAECQFLKNPAGTDLWTRQGTSTSIEEVFRKEKFKGPTGQLVDYRVKWQQQRVGPGERIAYNALVVKTLKQNQFAVTENCEHFLRTVPVIPSDDDNPEDVDTEAEDHCFAAGTLVMTADGCVPIELLSTGLVHTADGQRPFMSARKTKTSLTIRLRFNDESEVVCTPDHKFLTTKGWRRADRLMGYQIPCHSLQPSRNSVVNAITIAVATFSGTVGACIGRYGKRILAQFLTDTISTMPTKIAPTIQSGILNASMARSINDITPSNAILSAWSIKKIFCCAQRSGTAAKPAGNGIEKISIRIGLSTLSAQWKNSVRIAMDRFSRPHMPPREPCIAGRVAVKEVTQISEGPVQPVYCLTVPRAHNFVLSNGVIVANCWDMLKMSLGSRRPRIEKVEEITQGPKPLTMAWFEQSKNGRYLPPRPAR